MPLSNSPTYRSVVPTANSAMDHSASPFQTPIQTEILTTGRISQLMSDRIKEISHYSQMKGQWIKQTNGRKVAQFTSELPQPTLKNHDLKQFLIAAWRCHHINAGNATFSKKDAAGQEIDLIAYVDNGGKLDVIQYRSGEDADWLGEGNFGEVQKVRRWSDGSDWALKTTEPEIADIARLAKEGSMLRYLHLDGLVPGLMPPPLLNVPMDRFNFSGIVSEYFDGNLQDLTRKHTDLKVSKFEVLRAYVDVIGAVAYMHSKRIAHRDINIENMFYRMKTTAQGSQRLEFVMGDLGEAIEFSAIIEDPPENAYTEEDDDALKGLCSNNDSVGAFHVIEAQEAYMLAGSLFHILTSNPNSMPAADAGPEDLKDYPAEIYPLINECQTTPARQRMSANTFRSRLVAILNDPENQECLQRPYG